MSAKPRRRNESAPARTLVSGMAARRPWARVVYWATWTLLVLATLSTMVPLWWLITGALKTPHDLNQTPPSWVPHPWTLDGVVLTWKRLDLLQYFRNSALLAAGTLALRVTVSVLAAYGLSKLRPAGHKLLLGAFLTTLMIPAIIYFIPQYVTVINLPLGGMSLKGSWWGVWLPGAVSGFAIFVLKIFFDKLPPELSEAAYVDGASSWRILTRIILPLSKGPIAVVSIFTVIASWQDFLWPKLILGDNAEMRPLSVALYLVNSPGSRAPLNVQIGSLAIASIPMIILFLVFQRQIMRGVTFTGSKG
ncbi:carbohydrate ABC transporter permease [Dactylosporangium sp. CA-139066]|uniref:carbohydrate ABC transporter permease n=1 Tax=Dactylosporangium sp. CA-139066 TaxID=3239930 RepID=UPI003D8F657E